VLAYHKGGAAEIVQDGTGCLFSSLDPKEIAEEINAFEKVAIDYTIGTMRKQAMRFSKERFQKEYKDYVTSYLHSSGRKRAETLATF
jgi:glycosyltransferase involved in cell wall biosynthesis